MTSIQHTTSLSSSIVQRATSSLNVLANNRSLVVTAVALGALANLPGADGGPMTWAGCMAACAVMTWGGFLPACHAACLALGLTPTP